MRDFQHWRDKVELSLDGRQVFFLFFGGAVLCCLLFALGVMTGRRLEARAIALEAPSTEDPLAALDQLGDLEDEELTYHRALTKGSAKPAAAKVGSPSPAPAVAGPTPKPSAPAVAAPKATTPMVAPKPVAPVAPKPAAPTALPKPPAAHAEAPAETPAPKVATVSEMKGDGKETASPAVSASSAHFTLQLSAFSAKKDADEFMRRVQAAGYRPFVVSSDVAGKGLLYRVRVGDFPSKDAAIAEKTAVEKKLRVAAYLAKL